jgi:hypothetical protein
MDQKVDGKFRSAATNYEIILAEINKRQNSKEEKIVKVFEILDQIWPNLGVYVGIMKMVRQELFDAVFSEINYSGPSHSPSSSRNLERMSFYSLYNNLVKSRDEKNEQLKLEIKARETE